MRHQDSHLHALVLCLEIDSRGDKRHIEAHKTLPESRQQKEKIERGVFFEKLVKVRGKPEKRDRLENSCIWPSIWSLVYQREAWRA